MGQVYKAVTNGPSWKNTVLIINRDEWGGFYDTVAPPRVIAANDVDADLVGRKCAAWLPCSDGRGVPVQRRQSGHAAHQFRTLRSHLGAEADRVALRSAPALTPRDASNEISNLALALNFQAVSTPAPYAPHGERTHPNAMRSFRAGERDG